MGSSYEKVCHQMFDHLVQSPRHRLLPGGAWRVIHQEGISCRRVELSSIDDIRDLLGIQSCQYSPASFTDTSFSNYFVTDLCPISKVRRIRLPEKRAPPTNEVYMLMVENCEGLARRGFRLDAGVPFYGVNAFDFVGADTFGRPMAAKTGNSISTRLRLQPEHIGLVIWGAPHTVRLPCALQAGPSLAQGSNYVKTCAFEAVQWLGAGSAVITFTSQHDAEITKPTTQRRHAVAIFACDAGTYVPLGHSDNYVVPLPGEDIYCAMAIDPSHWSFLEFNADGQLRLMPTLLSIIHHEKRQGRAVVSLGAYVGNFERALMLEQLAAEVP